jgi:hypothetical protein
MRPSVDCGSPGSTSARYLGDLDGRVDLASGWRGHGVPPARSARNQSTAALAQPTRLRVNWV